MGEIKKLWAVRDPSPDSEMGDVLFSLDAPQQLANYILGTGGPLFHKENHKFYSDESSARKDAEKRMKAHDKAKGRGKKASSSDAILTVRVASRYLRRQDKSRPEASIHWGDDGC